MDKLDVLFLCTGNSARSLFGEYLLRKKDPVRFAAYSAGAAPRGEPHPLTLRTLSERFGIDAGDATSKSWKVFEGRRFDFVITVCDAARESCPVWPGQPIVAHWASPDPAAADVPEDKRPRLFLDVAHQISRRIDLLLNLPVEKLDRMRLEIDRATRAIGEAEKL
jgi:arsenate reductase